MAQANQIQIRRTSGAGSETMAWGEMYLSDGSTGATGSGEVYIGVYNSGTGATVLAFEIGAQVNTNSFSTVAVGGQSDVTADNDDDTLTLIAGTGMTITTSGNSVTFNSSGTGLPADDTTAIVQDPVDNTKRMRIDVENVPTATTTVLWMPSHDVYAVSGPGAAVTDNAIVRWDATGGQLTQNSTVIISDAGALSGITNITLSGTVDGRDVASDGTKLDGIDSGAEVNQNAYSTMTGNTGTAAANAKQDTFQILGGTDINVVVTDTGNDAIATVTYNGSAEANQDSWGNITTDSQTVAPDQVSDALAMTGETNIVAVNGTSASDSIEVALVAGSATAGVPNSKLRYMAANTIKGNDTGSAAEPADLTTTEAKALLGYLTSGDTSTDNAIVRWDGTTGRLVQDSGVTVDDSGNMVVGGNLTVSGTVTYIDSNTVEIGDSIILLNRDEAGAPSQNGGFEIERGTSTNVELVWNEGTDWWNMDDNTGTAYEIASVDNTSGHGVEVDGTLVDWNPTNTAIQLNSSANSSQVLKSSGTVTTPPSWATLNIESDITGVLPVANGGTGLNSFNANEMMYYESGTTLTAIAAPGGDGYFLKAADTTLNPEWTNVIDGGEFT